MKTCTEILVDALEAMASEAALPAGTKEAAVHAAVKAIMRTHPEIFWFSGDYSYDVSRAVISFRYPRDRQWRDQTREKIDYRVRYEFRPDRLLNLSDLEKVTYVYWWIAWRCHYYDYAKYPDSIAGVLADRFSCGQGFAKAAQYLLAMLGVRSELVYGRFINTRDFGEHVCWNRVYIDGRPFHFDVGVADLQRGIYYHPLHGYNIIGGCLWDFFCKSDSDIAYSRVIDDDCRTCACRHSLHLRDVGVKTVTTMAPGWTAASDYTPDPQVYIDGEIVECRPEPALEPIADETETKVNEPKERPIAEQSAYTRYLVDSQALSRRRGADNVAVCVRIRAASCGCRGRPFAR